MDIGIISIVISGIVAAIQIVNFISMRQIRNEDKLKIFARAEDIKLILDNLNNSVDILEDKVIQLDKNLDVLTERVDNEIKNTGKLLDKLDQELDKLK